MALTEGAVRAWAARLLLFAMVRTLKDYRFHSRKKAPETSKESTERHAAAKAALAHAVALSKFMAWAAGDSKALKNEDLAAVFAVAKDDVEAIERTGAYKEIGAESCPD